MAFSHDDKFFVASFKNGPEQSHVKCFEIIHSNTPKEKDRIDCVSQKVFIEDIMDVRFVMRNSKQILVTGEKTIMQYKTGLKELVMYSPIENVPIKDSYYRRDGTLVHQTFRSFCYMET